MWIESFLVCFLRVSNYCGNVVTKDHLQYSVKQIADIYIECSKKKIAASRNVSSSPPPTNWRRKRNFLYKYNVDCGLQILKDKDKLNSLLLHKEGEPAKHQLG